MAKDREQWKGLQHIVMSNEPSNSNEFWGNSSSRERPSSMELVS
jgi:hypothetical protein